MASMDHRRFAARMESMAPIREFVDEMSAKAGMGREDCLKLLLIVEELFTNTVVHGYRGDSDSPVWIALEPQAGRVTLSYEDAAPAHDPLASYRPLDTTVLMAQQPVGGLGVQLIRRLAADVSYRRRQDRNCIRLTFAAADRE